jgi:hypothetical protein
MVLIPSFLNSIWTRGKKIDERIDVYRILKIELPQPFLSKMKLLKNSPLGSSYQNNLVWKSFTATVYSVSNLRLDRILFASCI